MKKRVLSILLCAAMLFSVTACGSSAENNNEETETNTEEAADVSNEETDSDTANEDADSDMPYAGETVTVYTSYVDMEGWEPLTELVKEKTGIILEGVAAPTNYSDLVTKLSSVLTAGDDSFDIIHLDELLAVTYATAGYLEPINEVIEPEKDNYPQDVLERVSKGEDGNYYTLPMELNNMYFYVNTDVMAQAGVTEVPTTTDEFLEAAKAMTGDGVYGYGASWSKGGQLFNDLIRWMYSFDGDFYDWTKPESKEALQFMHDLIYEYQVLPEAALGDSYDAMNQKFIDNKYGMVFQFGFLADVCGDKWDESITIEPMPTFKTNKTVTTGWQMAINKNSKKVDAAKEVLKVWASEEGQTCNLKNEGSSHAAVLAKEEAIDAKPFGKALEEYVATGSVVPRPMSPAVNEIMQVTETYAQSYLSNQMSLDECAEKATEEIQKLLEE